VLWIMCCLRVRRAGHEESGEEPSREAQSTARKAAFLYRAGGHPDRTKLKHTAQDAAGAHWMCSWYAVFAVCTPSKPSTRPPGTRNLTRSSAPTGCAHSEPRRGRGRAARRRAGGAALLPARARRGPRRPHGAVRTVRAPGRAGGGLGGGGRPGRVIWALLVRRPRASASVCPACWGWDGKHRCWD